MKLKVMVAHVGHTFDEPRLGHRRGQRGGHRFVDPHQDVDAGCSRYREVKTHRGVEERSRVLLRRVHIVHCPLHRLDVVGFRTLQCDRSEQAIQVATSKRSFGLAAELWCHTSMAPSRTCGGGFLTNTPPFGPGFTSTRSRSLERWTLLLAEVLGTERKPGEGVQEFIARCWSAYSMDLLQEYDIGSASLPDADPFDDADVTAEEIEHDHEHIQLSDGTEMCPPAIYGYLSGSSTVTFAAKPSPGRLWTASRWHIPQVTPESR